MKNLILKLIMLLIITLFLTNVCLAGESQPESDWFYPQWVENARYNKPINVKDTDSALGRYSDKTKVISLKDIVKYHGHLCDGMVIAYIEIKSVLEKLFPDGIVDRTDLRVVSKNGPCWVDTVSYMTGARINFETLSLNSEIGDGFIIQKISTGETYDVHLKQEVFPSDMANLEKKIKADSAQGKDVDPEDIDELEKMAEELIKKLLNKPSKELIDIKHLKDFEYKFNFKPGVRTDVINKNVLKD